MSVAHILKNPVVTEKSMSRIGKNQYTFEVDMNTNKVAVAEAVSALFKVDVYDVKILIQKGKRKRIMGTRKFTQTPSKKLAIVTIDPKQSIDLFDELKDQSEE